jgi:hypothetical protein
VISAQSSLSRHRTPAPTPPPAASESADGTAVTSAGVTINASRVPGSASTGPFDTFALTSNQGFIIFNGVTDTITSSNVILLWYTGHKVYQENEAFLWWVWGGSAGWLATSDPRPTGGPLTAPPQATGKDLHGDTFQYTTLVFSAEFNSTSDVSADTTGTVPAPFYLNNPDFGKGAVTSYTISGGALTISVDNDSHGDGLNSVQHSATSATTAAPTTIVAGRPVYGYAGSGLTPPTANGDGLAFRYGYFECSIRTTYTNTTSSYFPTFWMFPTLPTQFANGFMELDIYELYPRTNALVSGSFGGWNAGPQTSAIPAVLRGANSGGYPPNSAINRTDPTVFNAIGVLWTPTFIQYWANGAGGDQISVDTAIPYVNGANPVGSFIGNDTMNIARLWMVIIIGTGISWPADYDYVRVFQ